MRRDLGQGVHLNSSHIFDRESLSFDSTFFKSIQSNKHQENWLENILLMLIGKQCKLNYIPEKKNIFHFSRMLGIQESRTLQRLFFLSTSQNMQMLIEK